MIEYSNIDVKFGAFTALPQFNLTIAEGEFFTLLGPSGCGKSTALRTLAGFIDPASGDLSIGGKRVTTLPSDKRGIGMVFQNYALFPSMSVGDNIAFGLTQHKVPKAEVRARVADIARQVNLTPEQLDKGVAELSGGQQQRVAIARALVLKPKILLLDEPLSNLDAALRQHLRVQLKDLQEQFGITTMYVTHDQEEALTLSDRIAVMNQGRIEQVGTPEQIYRHSATEFVCTFVGEAQQLDPEMVGALSARGATLDATLPSYLRIERVRILPARSDAGARVGLDGTVVARRYQGMTSTYRVQTASGLLRAVVAESGSADYQVGDAVRIAIDPADVLQYAKAGRRERMRAA